jgi:DNA-binding response OmpR family regulator
MPILNGCEATERIRALEKAKPHPSSENSLRRISYQMNGRIPIFAVSASLTENQRDELYSYGMDGWILKPIDFKRLKVILKGVTDPSQRKQDVYAPGCSWEAGGWFRDINPKRKSSSSHTQSPPSQSPPSNSPPAQGI